MEPGLDRRQHQTVLFSDTIVSSGGSAASSFGGTTEIMKEIIGGGLGL
jgi:hypothetical protein